MGKKKVTPDPKPRYDHDCKSCVFLGPYNYDGPLSDGTTEKFYADLWYCPESFMAPSLGPSLIARHSSEGSDYASMPYDIFVSHEASMRARPATHTHGLLEALDRYRKVKGIK